VELAHDDRSLLPEELQLVVLRLGAQHYALDITSVREVIFVPEITAIPRQPHHTLGVLNLRGRVLPVVDLRRALGLPPVAPSPSSRVVVAQDGRLVGLLADEVSQVATVAGAAVEPLDPTVVDQGEDCARGIVRIEGQIVVWLDLARLLSAPTSRAAVTA
jgi:purine-binding chemotaxis protein CheW